MTVVSEERLEQRTAALGRANEVRLAHVRIREGLSRIGKEEGCGTIAAMLDEPSGYVPSMRIGYLMTSAYRVGSSTIEPWLQWAHVESRDVRVRDLMAEQRAELADRLRRYGAGETSRAMFLADHAAPSPPPAVPVPKPAVRKAARKVSARVCQACGLDLRRVAEDGLCGFCVEEIEAREGQL